jgi:hypothetical protein
MSDHHLTVRPTVLNNSDDDFAVIWNHDRWGPRRIGRIRFATERNEALWVWSINPPMAVPAWGNGQADSLDQAKAELGNAWTRFVEMQSDEDWVRRLGAG